MRQLAMIVLLAVTIAFAAGGCKSNNSDNTNVPPPRAKIYYCPDHPQHTGVKGDRCKVCNAALIERPRLASTQPGD